MQRASRIVQQLAPNPTLGEDRKFADQVALVTGGAGGLGIGIAKELASRGATVILTDRGAMELKQAVEVLERQGVTGVHTCNTQCIS